jgi:ADP-heptose:LPS heptosyltransferase
MLKRDCRYFPGDRPCGFHKQDHTVCETCDHYAPRGIAILIIKLDALGDVLRTTSILPALHRRYGRCHVTWLTSPAARDLFQGNLFVDRVVSAPEAYLPTILSRTFDVVINPDAAPRSCELATIALGQTVYGYRLHPDGVVLGLSRAADRWLEMGGSDVLKRANKRTYQAILHEMCGLDSEGQHIVLSLTPDEIAARADLACEIGIDSGRPVVGLNTGAGGRWPLKKWRVEGFVELIEMILSRSEAQVILLGGEAESDRNGFIRSKFDVRVKNPRMATIRRLIRTVDLCDAVVTGDTLALHVGLGLKKRVVALFGPTSAAEIDMYGLGAKIVPDMDCVCCYATACGREPTCMDLISAAEVYGHLKRQMGLAASPTPTDEVVGAGKTADKEQACMVGGPIADW